QLGRSPPASATGPGGHIRLDFAAHRPSPSDSATPGRLAAPCRTSLFLGAACFAGRDSALRVVERNFQLVRDCRTDWLVDRLQTELNCSGWNFTTAHRSVCPQSPSAGAAGVLERQGWQWIGCNACCDSKELAPCHPSAGLRPAVHAAKPVTRLSGRLAGAALASGLALALLAPRPLWACQCTYQSGISDPDRRRQIGQSGWNYDVGG
uniref:Protein quiver n=1 Tax=Macrostomum lignano TaxID=282301 RepID=A0A1I8FE69_9PLAT